MTRHLILAGCLAAAVAAAGWPRPVAAQSEPKKEETPEAPPGAADAIYTPPLRGAPGGRVGGASRGAVRIKAPLPTIELLVPTDHAGQTASATPALHYFVSLPVAWPMQLTISAPLQPAPVLEATIEPARAAGIHQLRQIGRAHV